MGPLSCGWSGRTCCFASAISCDNYGSSRLPHQKVSSKAALNYPCLKPLYTKKTAGICTHFRNAQWCSVPDTSFSYTGQQRGGEEQFCSPTEKWCRSDSGVRAPIPPLTTTLLPAGWPNSPKHTKSYIHVSDMWVCECCMRWQLNSLGQTERETSQCRGSD